MMVKEPWRKVITAKCESTLTHGYNIYYNVSATGLIRQHPPKISYCLIILYLN